MDEERSDKCIHDGHSDTWAERMLSRANNTKCVRSALARSNYNNRRDVVEEYRDIYVDIWRDSTRRTTKKKANNRANQIEAELHTLEAELQHNKKYPAVADIYC
jgi:hypothetical protein